MTTLTKVKLHWATIRPLLTIRNERDYDRAIRHLNTLLDEVGDNERHPLSGLLDTLGTLIHVYEEEHFAMPACTGADLMHYFMKERGLTQADLAEIGSQGVVSEILSGKRELNLRQVRLLAKRFGVSPAAFI